MTSLRTYGCIGILCATAFFVGCAGTSQPEPDLSHLPAVPEHVEVRKLAEGFSFLEGPVWDGKHSLYFSDIPSGHIIRYDAGKKRTTVHREDLGRSNGLMFDPEGRLVICEQENRRITRLKDGKVLPLASHWDEKRLNSPNDLVIAANGGIYFTDPAYGKIRELMQLEQEAVYYITPKGALLQVETTLVRPNGLILSPDDSVLYVADNGARNIWRYNVKPDGTLNKKRKFADMDPTGGGGDGMTVDADGNVYCAGQGNIWQWAPDGTLLRKIEIPEPPSNITIGGPDGRTLYITARTSLYAITLNVRSGRP